MTETHELIDAEDFLPPSLELLQTAPLNHWVAVSADRVRIVASGDHLPSVVAEAKALGEEHPILAKNPPMWGHHAF
ncbi:MAG: hypothetical protein ABI147_08385 [Acidobacteriaceae bacterium]